MFLLFLGVVACGSESRLTGNADDPDVIEELPGFSPDAELTDVEDAGNNRELRDDTTWRADDAAVRPPREAPPDDDLDASVSEAFFADGTRYDLHLSLGGSSGKLASDPKVWVPATLTTDDGSWDVKVKLKGTNSFRPLSEKAAFRVNFAEDDPAARFHGLKRLALDNSMQDPSMMDEHAASWLQRLVGVPGPRHTYARLWVDGTYKGLYSVVEVADEQLLKRLYPRDRHGNLYEANVADFRADKTDRFELEETDGLLPEYTDIDDVIAEIDAASDDDYVATLGEIFDLDELLRAWSVDLTMTNPDGYAFFANNYYAYHGEDAWHIIPWSNDQGFTWYRDVHDFSDIGGHLLLRCSQVPECMQRLDDAMLYVVDTWAKSDFANAMAATEALIGADCASDPGAELPCDTEHVVRFVRDRPATVHEEIGR